MLMYKKTSLLVFFLLVSFSASASDAIQASVTPIGQPAPIVTYNGNPYSPGTYAVGTIQLFYTLTAFHFTAGPFATFRVNMVDAAGPGTAPTYPVNLNLVQTGSHNLILTPVLS